MAKKRKSRQVPHKFTLKRKKISEVKNKEISERDHLENLNRKIETCAQDRARVFDQEFPNDQVDPQVKIDLAVKTRKSLMSPERLAEEEGFERFFAEMERKYPSSIRMLVKATGDDPKIFLQSDLETKIDSLNIFIRQHFGKTKTLLDPEDADIDSLERGKYTLLREVMEEIFPQIENELW